MTRAIAILCLVLAASCKTAPTGPDPSLFPNKSKDWHDGFKKGFNEGLIWNAYTNQAP